MKISEWPKDDLEDQKQCPACGSDGTVLYSDLEDIVFRCAPGKWAMKCCANCNSGFLDPRPTERSISRAYEIYYTHGGKEETFASKVVQESGLLKKAINGRLNSVYGLKRAPASKILGKMLTAIPFVQSAFDPLGRSLHKPPQPGATLLDFGCGDGRFMAFAREMGWNPIGVDFDEKALAAAHALNLDVRHGGFEALLPHERFDAITMSHVIEHMHHPIDVLQKCYELLNADGIFCIETPNFDAYGRLRFGNFWRGLEAPRHLIIFTENSLIEALRHAKFSDIKCISRNFVSLDLHAASRRLKDCSSPTRKTIMDLLHPAAIYDGVKGIFKSSRREFLKFTAKKP